MESVNLNLSVMVRAEWDADAMVWVATSEDVPGLVAEHSDFAKLQQMVLEHSRALVAPDRRAFH